MTEPPEDRAPRNVVDRAARSTVGGESTAFGFSIMITVTFAAVQRKHGTPEVADLLLFAICAVSAFTVVEAVLSRGFRESLPEHASSVQTLGTAMNLISVAAAVAIAIALSALIGGDAAWLVCPAAAALVYLGFETVEIVAAERIQAARGNRQAADVGG